MVERLIVSGKLDFLNQPFINIGMSLRIDDYFGLKQIYDGHGITKSMAELEMMCDE